MGEFFKGWRRKAGLVTLAIGCLLAVAWMRSYMTKDEVAIPALGRQHVIFSTEGALFWMAWEEKSPRFRWMSQPIPAAGPHDVYTRDLPFSILLGDTITALRIVLDEKDRLLDESDLSPPAFSRWGIRHWLLVIPLTLLSAWLILVKARNEKRTQNPIDSRSQEGQ